MKKAIFVWLFMVIAFMVNGQGKTLYTVNMVKPKAGQKANFEAAWKAHAAKYHKTSDKRTVYEILSGPYTGYYQIVEGPISYADMDAEKPMAKEHSLDLDKNYFPMLEDQRMNATYRWDDSASFNQGVVADKFMVTVNHIKFGQLDATVREARRASLITQKINPTSRFSVNVYTQLWAGSDPVRVSVRNLKDGFKELETDYYGPNTLPPNAFKDAYIKDYGQDAWDARQKLLDNNANIQSREVFITRLRKDLSS
ncbi:MAG TPA: hypothetical protein VHL77_08680 [Ferruginibacter sp.]|nr:hypothetical protein [Ferruginibacter sp.]